MAFVRHATPARFLPSLRLFSSWAGAEASLLANCTLDDTIFALSSAPGRAAVAVIRLSGPAADASLRRLLPLNRQLPLPRVAQLSTLLHPTTAAPLDLALCLRFPAPRSATGQDVVELHCHGGPAVVRAVAAALACLPGLRPAEPGEFTRRAFHLGRLDLTEAEGLADLLAADTEAQRQQALAAAGGAARRQCETWRSTLLRCLARVEAVIDFGEDDEIGDEIAAATAPEILALREELEAHMAAGAGGEIVREGVRVALIGRPNAGKSSLLNALAGRDTAIVSSTPGTTRDVLEVALDLGGYKVVVTDGAGVRDSTDPLEEEGVRRAKAAAESAHILVAVREPRGEWWSGTDSAAPKIAAYKPVLKVLNKADLVEKIAELNEEKGESSSSSDYDLQVSCLTGEGLSGLITRVGDMVAATVAASATEGLGRNARTPLLNRERHRHHVGRCVEALRRFDVAMEAAALEVAAEELRGAAAALGRVVGAIDTEAVLDSVFAEFCIGK